MRKRDRQSKRDRKWEFLAKLMFFLRPSKCTYLSRNWFYHPTYYAYVAVKHLWKWQTEELQIFIFSDPVFIWAYFRIPVKSHNNANWLIKSHMNKNVLQSELNLMNFMTELYLLMGPLSDPTDWWCTSGCPFWFLGQLWHDPLLLQVSDKTLLGQTPVNSTSISSVWTG